MDHSSWVLVRLDTLELEEREEREERETPRDKTVVLLFLFGLLGSVRLRRCMFCRHSPLRIDSFGEWGWCKYLCRQRVCSTCGRSDKRNGILSVVDRGRTGVVNCCVVVVVVVATAAVVVVGGIGGIAAIV